MNQAEAEIDDWKKRNAWFFEHVRDDEERRERMNAFVNHLVHSAYKEAFPELGSPKDIVAIRILELSIRLAFNCTKDQPWVMGMRSKLKRELREAVREAVREDLFQCRSKFAEEKSMAPKKRAVRAKSCVSGT
jgi:hypothetical protein